RGFTIRMRRRRRSGEPQPRPGPETQHGPETRVSEPDCTREPGTAPSLRTSEDFRIPMALFLFLVVAINFPLVSSLKCYCTDDHCVPYGACEGATCLVGILKETNQVIRTCGNQKLGCYRDIDDKWSDLCVCSEPFCNTFSFLRQNTQKEKPHTFNTQHSSQEVDHAAAAAAA
ncbi:hypothetical protein PFISCL1PPCAC_17571, partial [Pristionchus fissidentatus]